VFDAAQKARVVFEPIIEPVILGPEAESNPAGFPLWVMTISSPSASRRNCERSSLISDSGTRLASDLRIALAASASGLAAIAEFHLSSG
jgi:hypothetical protein